MCNQADEIRLIAVVITQIELQQLVLGPADRFSRLHRCFSFGGRRWRRNKDCRERGQGQDNRHQTFAPQAEKQRWNGGYRHQHGQVHAEVRERIECRMDCTEKSEDKRYRKQDRQQHGSECQPGAIFGSHGLALNLQLRRNQDGGCNVLWR